MKFTFYVTLYPPLRSIVAMVLFWSFRLFRFGPFVLLFRVLVHAEIINDVITNLTF